MFKNIIKTVYCLTTFWLLVLGGALKNPYMLIPALVMLTGIMATVLYQAFKDWDYLK